MYADMSYSMLYQKMKKKFNLESNDRINLSVRLPSFDSMIDITDDEEVQFFVECASSTNEISHLYVSQPKKEEETANFRSTNQNQIFYKFFEHSPVENIGPSNIDLNTSNFNNNDSNMSFFNNGRQKIEHEVLKPESSFAFESFNQNENEQEHCFDGVDENPQPIHHNWNKFMSFKSDIPETPLYKSKPVISKQYNKVSDVKIGNTFDNQEALDLAVRLKALEDGYQFLSQKTTPDRYERKCYHFKECAWSIRARRWGDTDKFRITGMNNVHTCPKTQTYPNHRNANKKVIAHILNPKLKDNRRVLKGKDIQKDILSQYKTSISYQQAWRGKEYGLEQIRGSPYESFEMLPYYLHNLERKNKGTVTRIKTDEGVFEMLFIALGASIRTFVNHLRPLLIIDAAHLKGQYKGTNLVAVGMDGNNQIVPIAFGICKGETGPCWSWWMSVLKECIGDNPNLLFISDRHASIALAVRNEFPLAFHAQKNLEATWTYSKQFSLMRITSLWKSALKDGQEPIAHLYANMKHEITDWVGDKVHKRKLKSAMWIVNGIDQNLYQVYDGGYNREVNLMSRSCQCRKWQLSGIPCGHVIVVTRFLGLTDCVQFVADWFKKEKYQGTYAKSIHFVGDMHEWELPSHIHPAIPPRMDNPQPGRPKNTNRILSQGEEPRSIYCSRCHQAGHKRDQCNQPFVTNPLVNRPKKCPTYEQPPFYNHDEPYEQPSQPSCHNQYPSQMYEQSQYALQTYHQNPYESQPYEQHRTQQSQVYEQYDSQQYTSQHIDDQQANSWFKSFGF
ncbi:transposase, MuDR, MULE transposase domain protein [Tanacetum coccineum]